MTIAVIVGLVALVAIPLFLYQGGLSEGHEVVDGQGNVVGHAYRASNSQYRSRYVKAGQLLSAGDNAAAEAIYSELAKLESSNPDAFIGLAGAQVGQSNLAAARQNYAKAWELDPTNAEAMYGSGAVEALFGAPENAKEFYLEALAVSPDHGLSHFGMARACNELGDKKMAKHHAARYLELFPDSGLREEMLKLVNQE